jgi:hypothetical protein
MVMESMVFPIPSEAVMPFAGFLVVTGRFTLAGVIVASTLGSIVGSLASYAMGRYGGEPFFRRFGKYFLLDMHELEATQRYFQKRGQITIFVCRFIPVVRTSSRSRPSAGCGCCCPSSTRRSGPQSECDSHHLHGPEAELIRHEVQPCDDPRGGGAGRPGGRIRVSALEPLARCAQGPGPVARPLFSISGRYVYHDVCA